MSLYSEVQIEVAKEAISGLCGKLKVPPKYLPIPPYISLWDDQARVVRCVVERAGAGTVRTVTYSVTYSVHTYRQYCSYCKISYHTQTQTQTQTHTHTQTHIRTAIRLQYVTGAASSSWMYGHCHGHGHGHGL